MRDENGFTPLFIACEHGYSQIVQRLLNETDNETVHLRQKQKADVKICSNADVRDKQGLSPLCIACQANHGEVVKLLLEPKLRLIYVTTKDTVPSL